MRVARLGPTVEGINLADISPEECRKGALTKDGDRRALRVWLRDDLLFVSAGGDGTEQLTDDGKARVDDALAPNLHRLLDLSSSWKATRNRARERINTSSRVHAPLSSVTT